jgi:hypothetical protein
MKDQKKAYRRYKQETFLKKRAKKNYYWLCNKQQSWADFWQKIKSGKIHTWLRNFGTACSCYICSKHSKYKRPNKDHIQKMINYELEQN